ncbi:hypothetical protein [uncultured Cohaesibacter sp.]|uniref:hypothetical protein n=1 Tax=uncultured Cohaesibacter sp. TaxID=1002546 RepID=UPI0029C6F58B|nr:hypothetical protein [uncultured Cohaesibacter sp.]
MRLVTVEKDGAQLVGSWEGDDVTVIDVPDMRSLFDLEGPAQKVAAERLTLFAVPAFFSQAVGSDPSEEILPHRW